MGIDIPTVRWVIHFGQSYSLTDLYQESGRLSRDGNKGLFLSITMYIRFCTALHDKVAKNSVRNSRTKPKYSLVATNTPCIYLSQVSKQYSDAVVSIHDWTNSPSDVLHCPERFRSANLSEILRMMQLSIFPSASHPIGPFGMVWSLYERTGL